VTKKISRRKFLSSAVMLLFSTVALGGGVKIRNSESTGKPKIERTSRKKADYYRELAG